MTTTPRAAERSAPERATLSARLAKRIGTLRSCSYCGAVTSSSPPDVLVEHVAAFNAGDLDRLLRGFTRDALWATGAYSCRGEAELRALFAGAFAAISPVLAIERWTGDDTGALRIVAAELTETMTIEGRTVHAPIAGFYTISDGLIAAAKIYREGSAEIPDVG